MQTTTRSTFLGTVQVLESSYHWTQEKEGHWRRALKSPPPLLVFFLFPVPPSHPECKG